MKQQIIDIRSCTTNHFIDEWTSKRVHNDQWMEIIHINTCTKHAAEQRLLKSSSTSIISTVAVAVTTDAVYRQHRKKTTHLFYDLSLAIFLLKRTLSSDRQRYIYKHNDGKKVTRQISVRWKRSRLMRRAKAREIGELITIVDVLWNRLVAIVWAEKW